MDIDNDPIDRFKFTSALLVTGLQALDDMRGDRVSTPTDIAAMLVLIAEVARDLATTAEAFADQLPAAKPSPDAGLLSLLEKVAKIGGGVDVRA